MYFICSSYTGYPIYYRYLILCLYVKEYISFDLQYSVIFPSFLPSIIEQSPNLVFLYSWNNNS